jgi:hypothetical protein
MAMRQEAGELNPYIYARNLSIMIPFLMIAAFSSLLCLKSYSQPSITSLQFIRILARVMTPVLILCQIGGAGLQIRRISNLAPRFAPEISLSTQDAITNRNSLFVSSAPKHAYFILTSLGEFYYLTDDWNPRMSANYFHPDSGADVYLITESYEGSLESVQIGKLNIVDPIDGPVTFRELAQLDGFTPTPTFQKLVASTDDPY